MRPIQTVLIVILLAVFAGWISGCDDRPEAGAGLQQAQTQPLLTTVEIDRIKQLSGCYDAAIDGETFQSSGSIGYELNDPNMSRLENKLAIAQLTLYDHFPQPTPFGDFLYFEKQKTVEDEDLPDSAVSTWLLTYYYDGARLMTYDDKVVAILCCSPKYQTPDGFRVGDPVNKVLEAYPDIKFRRHVQGIISLGLLGSQSLEIIYENGIIKALYLYSTAG